MPRGCLRRGHSVISHLIYAPIHFGKIVTGLLCILEKINSDGQTFFTVILAEVLDMVLVFKDSTDSPISE